MKKRLLALGCVVALLVTFVAVGIVMRRRVPAVEQALGQGQPADYAGDWQAREVSLDLHIEVQGEELLVTGLESQPLVFKRSGPQAPFVHGNRRLTRAYKRLKLHQADGQTLDLRPRL